MPFLRQAVAAAKAAGLRTERPHTIGNASMYSPTEEERRQFLRPDSTDVGDSTARIKPETGRVCRELTAVCLHLFGERQGGREDSTAWASSKLLKIREPARVSRTGRYRPARAAAMNSSSRRKSLGAFVTLARAHGGDGNTARRL